jgi:hypothetical protein
MSLLVAPFFVAAALMALSGAAKLRRPDSLARTLGAAGLPDRVWLVRALATAEVAVGVACLVVPAPRTALALAGLYAVFAAFLLYVVAAKLPVPSCGCLGERETPPSLVHVGLDVGAAGVAVLVALDPVPPVHEALRDLSYAAPPFLAGCLAAGYLAYLAVAFLPGLMVAPGRAGGETSNERG